MKASITIDKQTQPNDWLVTWNTDKDENGESINLQLHVQFVHPSPRVSDLERAVLERAIAVMTAVLDTLPHQQDK